MMGCLAGKRWLPSSGKWPVERQHVPGRSVVGRCGFVLCVFVLELS